MRRIRIWTFLMIFGLSSNFATSCPDHCRCLPDPLQVDRQKLHCRFPSGSSAEFPAGSSKESKNEKFSSNFVTSLNIFCHGEILANLNNLQNFLELEHLAIRNCRLNLTSVRFSSLPKIRTIQFEKIRGFRFESEILKNSPNLEKISVVDSELRSIPDGELCSLAELKFLNLSGNALESLDALGISQCSRTLPILMLDLSRNSMISVKNAQQLANLHELNLKENALERLHLAGLTELRNLDVSQNRLRQVEFDGLSQLQIVDLSDNQLHAIPFSILSNSSTILQLNLSRNELDSNAWPQADSWNLPILQKLDLSKNRLQFLAPEAFANFSGLIELDLSENLLENLQNSALKFLPNLRTLDLSNNRLTNLKAEIFHQNLPNLLEFLAANNSISNIGEGFFSGISGLKNLDLSQNLLLEIPGALTPLYYLEELNLGSNRISTIAKFLLDKMRNVRFLNVAGNRLTIVERYVFENLPELLKLNLRENSIEKLAPDCFHRSSKLAELDLSRNRVRKIDGIFVNCPNLRNLNVAENQLTHLDWAMIPGDLDSLDASFNHLRHVTNHLGRSVTLKTVNFAENLLTHLGKETIPETVLNANVSGNLIKSIESEFPILESLDLSHNELTDLNETSLKLVQKLQLRGNPLKCSCNLNWLKQLPQGKIADFGQIICTDVFDSKNQWNLAEIPAEKLLCEYQEFCTETCNCCDFKFCHCNNVCPQNCRCFRDSKFQSNIVQCSKGQDGAENSGEEIFGKIPEYATKLFLDGLKIPKLKAEFLLGRYQLKELYLNSSGILELDEGAFNSLTNLEVLDLSGNALTTLNSNQFYRLPSLVVLKLNNNRLTRVESGIFKEMPNLKQLALHRNQLASLPDLPILQRNGIESLTLSENPWHCDCNLSNEAMPGWIWTNKELVPDHPGLYCFENSTAENSSALSILPSGSRLNVWTFFAQFNSTFCPSATLNPQKFPPEIFTTEKIDEIPNGSPSTSIDFWLWAIVGVFVVFAVSFTILIVYFLRKRKYIVNNRRPLSLAPSDGSSGSPLPLLTPDALIIHSSGDESFVRNQLAAPLEDQSPHYQLKLLYRDLDPETREHMPELYHAIERAHQVIVLISENFLIKEWDYSWVLRTALHLYIQKHFKQRVIFIVKMPIPCAFDDLLQKFMRTNVLLDFNDPIFWEKLRTALPDKILNSSMDGTVSTGITTGCRSASPYSNNHYEYGSLIGGASQQSRLI